LKKKVEAELGHGVGALAANVVDQVMTEMKFCQKVGEGAEKSIPAKVEQQGIRAKAQLELVKINLIVIKVTVTGADFDKMVADQKMPAIVAKVNKWLAKSPAWLRIPGQRFLLIQIKEALQKELPKAVKDDLSNEGSVDAVVVVKSLADETAYLFSIFEDFRKKEAEEEARKEANRPAQKIAKFTGKEEYSFGDITRSVVERSRGRISQFTSRENYQCGGMSKGLVQQIRLRNLGGQ